MIDTYRERQWMPVWAILLIGALALLGVGALIFTNAEGRAAAGVMAGVMSAILVLFGPMTTEVRDDHLLVQFGLIPVYRKRLDYAGMVRLDPCRYSPLREFGGWGIRGLGRSRALSARGDLGVRISMADGREWLIGSADPNALAAAIAEAMRARSA